MQIPAPTGSTTARDALFVALGIVTVAFLGIIIKALRDRAKAGDNLATPPAIWGVSLIANFFDTFGVGSFATTTTMFRHWKLVPDERIPGTLNVGYVLPTVLQASCEIVPVDGAALIAMIAARCSAWLALAPCVRGRGAVTDRNGLNICVCDHSRHELQFDAARWSGARIDRPAPRGHRGRFAMTMIWASAYALHVLVGLLGMNSTTAFPIMMGSCAFLMPIASVRFVRTGSYDARAMIGMLISGIPAVLVAAFIVKTMSVTWVQWLVVVVVTYTAVSLLRAARRERDVASIATSAEATA